MIKREEVEALLAASQPGVVTARDSDAFLRACDRLTRRMLAELARTWLRVNDAPVEVIQLVGGPDIHDYMTIDLGIAGDSEYRNGQRVRLVPEADSGGDRG